MRDVEAFLVPGGGITATGQPTEWVRARLDRAVRRWSGQTVISLSAGTTHKPPPLDEHGFPVLESIAGARYLLERGIPREKILHESLSYDTIGNACFARLLHTDPLGLRKLLVITSEFHMPRSKAVFDWVFGLGGPGYTLRYEAVENVGIDADSLRARTARESEGLRNVMALRNSIADLAGLHRWLFLHHRAYDLTRPAPSAGTANGTY